MFVTTRLGGKLLLTLVICFVAHMCEVCSAQLILRHVTQHELQVRAGYFDASTDLYMGGVPTHEYVHRYDDCNCTQTIAGNKTYCTYWHITQSASGGSVTDGECKCTSFNAQNNT